MTYRPKVLVAGTGFAGQGHVDAFRAANAEIIGIVGRTPSVVSEIAKQASIPFGGTNWEDALIRLKPDIVAIGTPGGAHYAQVKQAIAHGCHVFCDKPLTHSGDTAAELRDLALARPVKTAFAASFQFTASVQHAGRLVASGAIGEPTEVESISHFNLERGIPFGWSHRADAGGGRLNNNFTHSLAIVTSVVGDKILSVCGDVRDDLRRAPIVKGVHNFTKRREFIPADLDDPCLEWGESDVEWSYTVMARIESELSPKPVSVLFKHGGLVPRYQDDHIIFYGTKGAIYLKGHYGSGPLSYHDGHAWQAIPLPADIASAIPDVPGETAQCWHILAKRFVNDIKGETAKPYPTFAEGARYQQIIDIVRRSDNWTSTTTLA